MSRPPRVLVVSPVPSHPPDQGNAARILALGAELKQRGLIVEFYYYGMEGLTNPQRAEMEGFWADFHFLPSSPLPRMTFPRFWGLDDWCPDALCTEVAALHERRGYDAVLVNYVWMSKVLTGLRNSLRILDTHDLFGDRHLVSVRDGLEPSWFFTSLAQENEGFQRADLLIGIQDHETASIQSRVRTPAITVGHPMEPLFLTRFADGKPIATFGYLGSGNPWNVRSVAALDEALGPDSKMDWLVAGSLTKQPLRLKSGAYVLGVVPKLEDFYRVVDCVVNPMMGGTGLKIKTIEALAFGKPVIGTKDAFQGLPVRHDAHRLTDAAACAAAMSAYKHDAAYRDAVRLASRVASLTYMGKVGQEIDVLRDRIVAATT